MALNVGTLYYDITADTGKLIGQSREVEKQTGRMVSSLTAVAVAAKALAAAYVLLKSAQLADDMRLLFARVQVAAGGIENAAKAMRGLQEISNKTQTSIAANAGVFGRLNSSLLQMGGTQEDTLRLTSLLAQAIKVSGGSAQEASAAMLQFGQALGSGQLAGDEFKSLMETAPFLMKQLAAGIGVPIGALKALAADGKLTADVVVEALGKAAGQIEADFQKLPQTMSGAMQVAQDAAARLAEKLDDVSGVSAAMTGVTSGLGTTLDLLAESFSGSSSEADKLGRSDTVKTWASATTKALSYVVDAADFVTRGFQQMGTAIGGSAAAAAAVARGELEQAANIMSAMKADVLAIGAADYRGAGIRARVDAQPAGSSVASTFSKLKAPAVAGKPGKAGRGGSGESFDSAGYLAGLERTTLEGVALVDAAEKEALRRNAELLTQRKINADTSAQAITLIERNAAQERGDIRQREADQARDIAERAAEVEQRRAEQEAESRARGLQMAQDAAVINDPVAQLELRLVRESELLTRYAMQDLANAQFYAQAKVALEQETALQVAAIRSREVEQRQQNNALSLAMAGDFAGQLLAIEQNAGREHSALAKALFLTQKALAIAEIIINTEVAAAKVKMQLGIFGIPMATLIRASGYASAGLVAGTAIAGGRQYGGPVDSGSLYRVNEGGRPEMFTSANGAQYMMPTADGNVTPSNRVGGNGGGGQVITIIQHNTFSSPTDPRTPQQLGAATARGLQMASARNN